MGPTEILDDFRKGDAFFRLQAVMAGANQPNFAEVESENPKLQKQIAAFDRTTTLSAIAGLLTFPSLHANTVRLELLQNLVHRNANGPNKPTAHRLSLWLNKELGPTWAARMEDPVEDVFISNVVSHIGNSRIFEGIWEANDFWLQQALDALRQFENEQWAKETFAACFGLLQLSDALAGRCALERYGMGSGDAHEALTLPPQHELENRAAMCRFSFADLEQLHVPVETVQPFIHAQTVADGSFGKSSLERRPLVMFEGGVVFALPTAVSPALRQYIAERVVSADAVTKYEGVLLAQQYHQLFNQGMRALDSDPVDASILPKLPEGTPAKAQEIARFDEGKFAHVIFFEDSVLEFLKTGMSGILEIDDAAISALIDHTKKCADILATRPDYTGGLTIGVLGGLGRAFIWGFPELPHDWYGTGFRLPDLLAIGRVRHVSLLEIWKLHHRRHELEKRKVRIMEFNGELNLLGFYRQQGERLIPRDAPAQGAMIGVDTDFLAEVRRDLRSRYNLHAIERRNPDMWIPVRRENVDPFFKEVLDSRAYVDEAGMLRGQLRGAVETDHRAWWISSPQRQQTRLARNIQYRVWDAGLAWLQRIAPLAEPLLQEINGPIEIYLEFHELDSWISHKLDDLPSPAGELTVAVNRRADCIRITVPLSFFRHFAVPANVADRKLVKAVFVGVNALVRGDSGSAELDRLVEKVVTNSEARFFHLVWAQDYRQNVAASDPPKPHFVFEGDSNFVSIGLSHRLLKTSQTTIDGQTSCNKFLHAVVDDSWSRILERLVKFDRSSVVSRALRNVEAIELDKEQWRLTASALLAVHQDREDVVSAANERENDRSAAALTTRVLAEMAACNSPQSGGRIITEADFHELLALVELLISSAHASDAIRYALTPPEITIFANGEFAVDRSYQQTVMIPYVKEHFNEQFAASASAYPKYFNDPRDMPKPSPSDFPSGFVEAFQAEFGFTPDELFAAYHALANDAMPEQVLVVTRTGDRFRQILAPVFRCERAIDAFINNFTLQPRDRWDSTPAGFSAKDWYPWRYRRRLSLIMRPFVRDIDGKGSIIFAPGLVHDGFGLLLTRLLTGRLPADDFRSAEMRSWIGEVTRQRGDEFEIAVAEEFKACGLQALSSRPMTEFGADESYGDLDALAWTTSGSIFYAVECKRLRFARTVGEVGEQLREFRGEEMDRLAKHMRRCAWLRQRVDVLRRVSKTSSTKLTVIPLLVPSTLVPMQFVSGLPLDPNHIVAFNRLRDWLKAQSST